jgi:hypothetical protein
LVSNLSSRSPGGQGGLASAFVTVKTSHMSLSRTCCLRSSRITVPGLLLNRTRWSRTGLQSFAGVFGCLLTSDTCLDSCLDLQVIPLSRLQLQEVLNLSCRRPVSVLVLEYLFHHRHTLVGCPAVHSIHVQPAAVSLCITMLIDMFAIMAVCTGASARVSAAAPPAAVNVWGQSVRTSCALKPHVGLTAPTPLATRVLAALQFCPTWSAPQRWVKKRPQCEGQATIRQPAK